jgi:hypothetical protein
VSERESLELVETTEYIQKSREIAGEQTLYRYNEIPWFVVPFTTVYSYLLAGAGAGVGAGVGVGVGGSAGDAAGLTVVPVSSANFALFYAFITERTRDFHCCILNELTQLQSLVEHKLYRIYLLLWNETRVVAMYLFTRSNTFQRRMHDADHSLELAPTPRSKTKGNRIHKLHDYISNTSTALVKYLPPVRPPKYDAFGKRVSTEAGAAGAPVAAATSVLRLVSSIQLNSLCDTSQFLYGFQSSYRREKELSAPNEMVMIDTLAHNYRLIDALVASKPPRPRVISREKWYYILYNAIIHKETLCKDILMI